MQVHLLYNTNVREFNCKNKNIAKLYDTKNKKKIQG